LSSGDIEKLIEDYEKRETSGERQRVANTAAAIRQEQEDTETAHNTALMS
jgi:hypothetical protein